MDFTNEELQNILVLINNAPITGMQAETVVLLKQKVSKILASQKEDIKEPNKEK